MRPPEGARDAATDHAGRKLDAHDDPAASRSCSSTSKSAPSAPSAPNAGILTMATATTTRPSPTVSKTTIQPLDDHLLVRPNDPERSTASGLVIPDTATEKPDQGTVLAVGPGRRSDHTGDCLPLDIAVGSTVVFAKFGGTQIRIDGADLLILSAKQVLATITENGQK